MAVERGGTNSSCSATDLHCNVPNLLWGATYTFPITAVNSFCRSAPGKAFQIQTAPCALSSITAHTDCYSSRITVSWKMNEGSFFYVATAEVPCEPQNMTVKVQCDTRTATLFWVEGHGSLQYFTTPQTIGGHTFHCDTTNTSCSIHKLTCGTLYNFSALASDGTCNISLTVPIQRGEEMLAVPEVRVAVMGQSLQMEWFQVMGAESYTLIVSEDNEEHLKEDVSVYRTEIATVTDLEPATLYCIIVSAKNHNIQSTYSQPVRIITDASE